MTADVTTTLATWSTSESSNLPVGTTAISTNLDDNLRMIQAVVRSLASTDTIASATTCDLGTKTALYIDVTGTTTITGLGTISAGIWKLVKFSGILTLTHNATSLILPSAANITTAAGDTALFLSAGSGNWRCLFYTPASGFAIKTSLNLIDGSEAAPSMYFASDIDTGIYRIGANSIGFTGNGVKIAEFSTTNGLVLPTKANLGTYSELLLDGTGAVLINNGANGSISITTDTTGVAGPIAPINITAGSQTQGGVSSNYGGDVTIRSGDYTFASGAGGYRAGNISLIAGNCSDPGASAEPGQIILRCGDGSSGATGGKIYIGSSATVGYIKVNDNYKSITLGGTVPVITSGAGAGATIAGNANAFKVTVGTGAGTAMVFTFAAPRTGSVNFLAAPIVQTNLSVNIATWATSTTTTVTVNFGSAPANGDVLHVTCFGYE